MTFFFLSLHCTLTPKDRSDVLRISFDSHAKSHCSLIITVHLNVPADTGILNPPALLVVILFSVFFFLFFIPLFFIFAYFSFKVVGVFGL